MCYDKYLHACVRACVRMCAYVRARVHVCTCMFNKCTRVCACVCVCTCARVLFIIYLSLFSVGMNQNSFLQQQINANNKTLDKTE